RSAAKRAGGVWTTLGDRISGGVGGAGDLRGPKGLPLSPGGVAGGAFFLGPPPAAIFGGQRPRPADLSATEAPILTTPTALSGGTFSALPTLLSFSFLPSRLLASA